MLRTCNVLRIAGVPVLRNDGLLRRCLLNVHSNPRELHPPVGARQASPGCVHITRQPDNRAGQAPPLQICARF
ncbi:MAG: hypothetical protein LBM98_07760 [Oscillospiraceae bacterium]|nr:hypothetical protein [Oscillospiraceae bacterium]